MQTIKTLPVLGAVALLAISLTGCSTATPVENADAACDAYSSFVGVVAEAKSSIDASSSIGDIAAARDDIKAEYAALNESLADVTTDRQIELEAAWGELDNTIAELDDTLTVPEAIQAVQGSVADVERAQEALAADLTC